MQHPDLSGLVDLLNLYCPKLLEVSINTSGLNPTEMEKILEIRESLKSGVFLNVTLSIDGVGELHNRIRGVKSAWSNVLVSLSMLRESIGYRNDCRVLINYTISRDNHHREAIFEIVKFAREAKLDLSLTYGAVNDLYLRNDNASQLRFTLQSDERQALSATIEELLEDSGFTRTQKHFFRMLISMLHGEQRSSGCVYQSNGIFLDLDGTVYPCGTSKRLAYGKLPQQSFEEIYAGKHGERIREELIRSVCIGCPSNSYYGLAKGVWLDVLRAARAPNKLRNH
jgi:sulfatase maturation enzyme AslB (radical SAM superfamily)